MPKVGDKKFPYTAKGKAEAKKAAAKKSAAKKKSMLTPKQKTLPKELQKKIVKSKRKPASGSYSRGF